MSTRSLTRSGIALSGVLPIHSATVRPMRSGSSISSVGACECVSLRPIPSLVHLHAEQLVLEVALAVPSRLTGGEIVVECNDGFTNVTLLPATREQVGQLHIMVVLHAETAHEVVQPHLAECAAIA